MCECPDFITGFMVGFGSCIFLICAGFGVNIILNKFGIETIFSTTVELIWTCVILFILVVIFAGVIVRI